MAFPLLYLSREVILKKNIMASGAAIILLFLIISFLLINNENNSKFQNITKNELDKLVSEKQKICVVLYSPDCITCRKLKKEISNSKKEEKKLLLENVYWVDVDISQNAVLLDLYNVEGVPTILCFQENTIIDIISGNLTSDKLLKFIQSETS